MKALQLKSTALTGLFARVSELATIPRVALALICSVPFLFSMPQISDPFGASEEGVNAAIWALGGRNILRDGPVDALFGARVAPYAGSGGGVYAHHPPLPVWLSAACLAFGSWEGWPRLLALLAAIAALKFLYDCLRHFFEEAPALIGVAAAATTPYLLESARMLTTLTLAAPFVLLLLREALRANDRPLRARLLFLSVIPLAVFSSWDAVIGAGAVILFRAAQDFFLWREGELKSGPALGRIIVPGAVGLVSLALLATYFAAASGGLSELIHQAMFRAGVGGGHVGWREFLASQVRHLVHGLGAIPLLCLPAIGAVAVAGGKEGRKLFFVTLVSAAPALGMTLLFRNGAHYHFFWAYNLFAPAAFAVALVASKVARSQWRVFGTAALAAQMVWSLSAAAETRAHDERANSVGALVRSYFKAFPVDAVPMFSAYDFHPYVTYYLDVTADVATSPSRVAERLESGTWRPLHTVLADSDFLRNEQCGSVDVVARSADRRWVITTAGSIAAACKRAP